MKTICTLVLIQFFGLIHTQTCAQIRRYQSKEAKFSLGFPDEYAETEQTYDKGKMVNVTSVKDDNMFWVNYTIFNKSVEGSELILVKEALDNFVMEMGCHTESKRENIFLSHKCMDATLKTADNATNIYLRIFFVGNIRYELAVMSAKDLAGTSEKFFSSFKFE
jgi:hypothetical protein